MENENGTTKRVELEIVGTFEFRLGCDGSENDMRLALGCLFIVCVVTWATAEETKSEKRFDKPAQEVYEAAERVVEGMRVEIRERDVNARRLVFSDMRSGFGGSYAGYRATFEADLDPKSGKTIARLRTIWARWSPTGNAGMRLSWGGEKQFFADLKRELGLCTKCGVSPITGGGGLNLPRTH